MEKHEADKIISFIHQARKTMEHWHFVHLCVELEYANMSDDKQSRRVWRTAFDIVNKELGI